jgi:hypothetical protein
MRGNHWSWSVLALCAALAACDAGREEQVTAACTAFCRCDGPPVPTLQEQCVNECVADLVPAPIPEACLSCITAHANRCATIEIDCEPVCDIDDEPQPVPPNDDPPIPVDAFVADPEPKEGL